MQRQILHSIEAWFNEPDRKPLVLRGARQVGKTYAVQYFAENYILKSGGKYHYIDLKAETKYHSTFKENSDPAKIIELIEVERGIKIDLEKDLLFFDEIQECGEALAALKYFEQKMKKLAIVVAGSHLGLINTQVSFPVGKVNFLSMFPMTFLEFVEALDEKLLPYIHKFNAKECVPLPTLIHEKLLKFLSYYFVVGGLPDAVEVFRINYRESLVIALKKVRSVQDDLLAGYMSDFSQYAETVNANHIQNVFESIPKQLSRSYDEEVKKYKFSGVIPNQKGFDRIIGPLSWLCKSRLCIKSFIANKSSHPLSSYTKDNVFKVFFFDIGLLNAFLKTPVESIIANDLGDYKGFIAENFVAQEIYAYSDRDLLSWNEGTAEVEFLVMNKENIIPIEVKASKRWQRAKSLTSFINRYSPKFAYKVTSQNAGKSKAFSTLPMYLVYKLFK